jgi:RNA 3'-terminal phosphate cyclase (ATP)
MITIDGSLGEGGGQVLRTALSLAMVTGQPFVIERIRAGREKPGLKRQHLTAVLAAAELCDARVEGAELGSLRLAFRPGSVRPGDYRFAIGSAGSAMLVLQTLLPALWQQPAASSLEVVGGTHNPLAPSFDFLEHAFAPAVRAMGAPLQLTMHKAGFYPAGGGQVRAEVGPATWRPIERLTDAAPPIVHARVLLAQVPPHVAVRERKTLCERLGIAPDAVRIVGNCSPGPGNAIVVVLTWRDGGEVVTTLGERGLAAEEVAHRAADAVDELRQANVPVGPHLADQLLLPMALAGGGTFRTVEPTMHTRTNAEVIGRFLPVRFTFEPEPDGAWRVDSKG